jgi:hypothetical protein
VDEFGIQLVICSRELSYRALHSSSICIAVGDAVQSMCLVVSSVAVVVLLFCWLDAKSCYDCIIMVFMRMLCQKHGVPQSVCMMAAMTLLRAECSIKNKYGVSSETYSSTADNPIHGPGQGSHMTPALWLIICCLLFEAMSKLCTGAEFYNPRRITSHQRTGDGFVDDVTNFLISACRPCSSVTMTSVPWQKASRLRCRCRPGNNFFIQPEDS